MTGQDWSNDIVEIDQRFSCLPDPFLKKNNCNDNNHPNMVLPNFYGQFHTSQREQDRW